MAYPTNNPLPFPALRKENSAKKNPIFVSDIVVLNKQLFTGLKTLLGLPESGATAFAILSGMTYNSGAGTYGPNGVVYMNGNFYYFSGTLVEGKYLAPSVTDSAYKTFSDGTQAYIYSDYYCISSNTMVDSMPQFSGNMDRYRINITDIKGSSQYKVPVIGSTWTDNYLVTRSGTTIVAATPISLTAGSIANNQSTLVTGEYVKVSGTGLESRDASEMATDLQPALETFFYDKGDLGNMLRKAIVLPGEDLNTGSSVSIAHGLTLSKIYNVSYAIKNNDGTALLNYSTNITNVTSDATNVVLTYSALGATYNNCTIILTIDYIA